MSALHSNQTSRRRARLPGHSAAALASAALSMSLACSSNSSTQPPISDEQICAEATVGPPLLRRLTNSELESSIGDIFPTIKAIGWAGVKLGVDPVSHMGFGNDAQVLQVNQQTAQEILDTAEDVATYVTNAGILPLVLPCSTFTPDRTCATTFVRDTGRRLFRRPLADSERNDYLGLYDSVKAKADFASAIKWTLVAMIESPHSIYRSELGVADGDGYGLTQHELASELSYTFSGTTPSVALLDKADRGELSTPDVLLTEAKALLATPRGQEVVRQLFRSWFRYERAATVTRPDVPNYFTVRNSLVEETKRFIDQVVLTDRGGINQLLTANYTFLDPMLVTHYGYGAAGAGFVRTQRPAQWGIGVLAQGSILAANAQAQGSSPTQRGLLVFEKLLCSVRPEPPKNIPPLPPIMPGQRTTRDRYESQHAVGSCAFCHKQFDPIGFTFEHFDEVGRYRKDEKGLAINDSGRAMTPTDEVRIEATGQVDLVQKLAARDDVHGCAADMMAAFAYGLSEGQPRCLVTKLRPNLTSGDQSVLDYLTGLTASPHFTRRR